MIEFRLLGTPSLVDEAGKSVSSVLVQPRRTALLAYLACARPRGFQRRDTLLALFWPEADETRGRAALSQAVYYLRRSLGSSVLESRGNDELRVATELLWCDVVALEDAVESGRPLEALDLFRGDLLEAFHLRDAPRWEKWLDEEQARSRGLAVRACWSAAEQALAAGDRAAVVRLTRRVDSLAPYDDLVLCRRIRMLDRLGDTAGAIRAFEETAVRFETDLGVAPSEEARKRVAEIRARPVAELTRVAHDSPAAETPHAAPAGAAIGPPRADSTHRPDPSRVARAARRLASRPGLTVALGALALSLAAAWWIGASSASDPDVLLETTAEPLRRIAVLPFASVTPESSGRHVALGMSDELRTRISRIGGLRVIAGSSVRRYGESDAGAAEIGRDLSAATLIEGTLTGDRTGMRVVVDVVDAADEVVLWSGAFDGSASDLIGLQGDIVEAVVRALGVVVRDDERRRLATSGTASPEAFRLYLEGRARLGSSDPDGVRAARDLFTRALAVDSTFARALAGLADVYDELAGMQVLPSDVAYPQSREYAEAALSLDEELAEAHVALAQALAVHYWDSERAVAHFRRSIDLDPSSTRARRAYAALLRNLGRYQEAATHAEVAAELGPGDLHSQTEPLIIAYFSGRYDVAAAGLRRVAERNPRFGYAHVFLALAEAQRGRYEVALAALDAMDEGLAALPDPRCIRGYILGKMGRSAEARDVLASFEEAAGGGASLAFNRAVVQVGLGEHEAALSLLETAASDRDWHVRLVGGEPIFHPLRTDPRFEAILARVGLVNRS